jgi:hypothetical protein
MQLGGGRISRCWMLLEVVVCRPQVQGLQVVGEADGAAAVAGTKHMWACMQ